MKRERKRAEKKITQNYREYQRNPNIYSWFSASRAHFSNSMNYNISTIKQLILWLFYRPISNGFQKFNVIRNLLAGNFWVVMCENLFKAHYIFQMPQKSVDIKKMSSFYVSLSKTFNILSIFLVVVRQPYDIRVEGNEVFLGNVAFLRCFIPEHVRKFVVVSSWYRGNEELLAGMADMGKLKTIIFNYLIQNIHLIS